MTQIRGMAGGLEHVVAVDSDGKVWTWGLNASGQLGNGSLSATYLPRHVNIPTPISKVAASQADTFALSADGKHVYAWGDNEAGGLGIGTSAIQDSEVPVEVKIPLKAGQTVTSVTATGQGGGLALLSNGRVVGWGANEHGQAGQSPMMRAVYTPRVIKNLSHVVALAAGDHQTLALKANGTVWAFGANRYGQLGPNGPKPSLTARTNVPVRVRGLPKIAAVEAGGESSLALDRRGHVWAWGRDGLGQLGRGTADRFDRGPHPHPRRIAGLSGIVSLSGEGPTALAADADGNVFGWGYNRQGEVGRGPLRNTGTPRKVLHIDESPDASGPSVHVVAGHWFSYAYNAVTGQAYAWGRNTYGELRVPPNTLANEPPIDLGTLLPCFASGTRIRTDRGDVAVEHLRIGDLAVTASGERRPIVWLGHRKIGCARHPNPAAVRPIRIGAHAFGENRPMWDLVVSPGHAICIDVAGEVLIPAGALVDGSTIVQVAPDTVTYWHVELEDHDILLAENMATESYLDSGNRAFFVETAAVSLHATPDSAAAAHERFCRPFVARGPRVDAVRARLGRHDSRRVAHREAR